MAELVLDAMLVATMLWLGWKTVSDQDLFRATLHFIGLGLVVATAWVRLHVPNVALAEAAVGAGLTGALVIATVSVVLARRSRPSRRGSLDDAADESWSWTRATAALGALGLAGLVARALLAMPTTPRGLTQAALGRLDDSGTSNPVTAALLNYRGYDTLLEITVLLVAVVAVWSIRVADIMPSLDRTSRTLPLTLTRVIVPGLVLAAGYLLWRGAFAPGGAFQAGALLGGAAVLLLGCGAAAPVGRHAPIVRIGLAAGTSVFTILATTWMGLGLRFLEYPVSSAAAWMLVIEIAATVSIGLTLAALYLGGRPTSSPTTPPTAERP